MHKDKYVFSQLVSFLDRNKFNYIVRKSAGDKYVKHFTCWNQLLTLMFGQLSNRESLRDLIVALDAHYSKCYHLGMGRYVGGKFDASYNKRVLAQDADRLVDPFRNRTETSCWQSEFWGKWFTSAVLAYKYKPEAELKAKLNKAVDDLIATQASDGYIGNYADDKHLHAWDIWGRKYCMLGLIAWYDISGEKKALDAAGKIAIHLKKEASNAVWGLTVVRQAARADYSHCRSLLSCRKKKASG